MAGMIEVSHGNERVSLPCWETVRDRLLGLRHEKSVSLSVSDDDWLIVHFIGDLGYMVSGCAEGDKDYFNLIDRSLGDDPVSAFDGGNTNEHPRYVFVSAELMLKAIRRFFETGDRDPDCEWVNEEEAFY